MDFSYNNIDAATYNFKLISKTPPQKARRQYQSIVIPNRDSPVIKLNDNYESYFLTYVGKCNDTDLDNIYAWLQDTGTLIDGDDTTKYYKVTACEKAQTERLSETLRMVTVTFECMPFRYVVDNFVVTSTSNNFQIENTGKKYSRPQYLLTASATSGQLKVNLSTKPLTFSNVEIGTKIMIDTELMIVYNYDNNTSLLQKTNGLLPFLNVGNNLVQTQGVSQIEILKNERWF